MLHARPKTSVAIEKKVPIVPNDSRIQYTHVSSLPLNTPIIHSTRPYSADVRRGGTYLPPFRISQCNRQPSPRQTLNISAPTASIKPDLPYFIDPCIEQYTTLDVAELSSPRPPKTPSTSEDVTRNSRYIIHPQFRGTSKLTRSINESCIPTAGWSTLSNEINIERARINPIVITGTFPFNEDLTVSQSLPTRILSTAITTAPSPYKNIATARSIPTVTFPKKENNTIKLHAFKDADVQPLLTAETSNSKTPRRKICLDQDRCNLKISCTPDILHKDAVHKVVQQQHTKLKKVVMGDIDDISIHNTESFHTDQMPIDTTINNLQEQSVIREQRGGIPSRIKSDRGRYKSGHDSQLSQNSIVTVADIYMSESLTSLEKSVGSPTVKKHAPVEDDIKIFTAHVSPFNIELSGRAVGLGHTSMSCEPSSDSRPEVSINTRYLLVSSLSQTTDTDKLQKERPSTLELLDDRMYPQKTQ